MRLVSSGDWACRWQAWFSPTLYQCAGRQLGIHSSWCLQGRVKVHWIHTWFEILLWGCWVDFCLRMYYKKPIMMPMKFQWYVCIQQVIPGALGPGRPLCFTSAHSALPNRSHLGTHLHAEPYVSPWAVSGGAYSWVCRLYAKPGGISACPSEAKLEPVHEWSIQVNGFHSPPGKPTFHSLEPPKGMFAHQQSCSHAGEA